MKTKFFAILSVCLMVLPCVFLTGCDVDYKKFEGNYYLSSVTNSQGSTKTIDKLIEENVVQNKEQEVINLTREQNLSMGGIIGENSGTYEISEDAIIIKFENSTIIGSIKNDIITLNISGSTYVYTRSK